MKSATPSNLIPCLLVIFIVILLPLSCHSSPRIVDLSYTYDKRTPNHPKLSRFDLRVVKKGLNKYGVWVELNDFFSSEHSGTHVDAPVHFTKNAKSVDQIAPRKFYRIPGVMMDLTENVQDNGDYEISPRDLQEWVDAHGEIPDGAVVLIQTGWGQKAFDQAAYSGVNFAGEFNYPSLGADAARWIVNYGNRSHQSKGIVGVGLDVMSLDRSSTVDMKSHVIILGAGLYGIENVANLNELPAKGFTLSVFPMKIGGGSGAPARVIAEIGGAPYIQSLSSFSLKIRSSTSFASFILAVLPTFLMRFLCI